MPNDYLVLFCFIHIPVLYYVLHPVCTLAPCMIQPVGCKEINYHYYRFNTSTNISTDRERPVHPRKLYRHQHRKCCLGDSTSCFVASFVRGF